MFRNNRLVSATPCKVAIISPVKLTSLHCRMLTLQWKFQALTRGEGEGDLWDALPALPLLHAGTLLFHLPGNNCFQARKMRMGKYSVLSLLLAGGPGGFNLREGVHDMLQGFGDSLETIYKICVCAQFSRKGVQSLAYRKQSINIPSKN